MYYPQIVGLTDRRAIPQVGVTNERKFARAFEGRGERDGAAAAETEVALHDITWHGRSSDGREMANGLLEYVQPSVK